MSQGLSFTNKAIEVEIILADGDFGEGNTKILKGFGVELTIEKPGPPEKSKANISIYGLSLDDLSKLTTLSFIALQSQKNLISVKAGSDFDSYMSVVFAGEISSAFADFNKSPDVTLEIKAISGFYPQRKDPLPTSVNGEATAESLVSTWAADMGYSFVNYGVDGSVRNTTFTGSSTEKIAKLSRQLQLEILIDDNEVIMLPTGATRPGEVPYITPDTGLIAYPTFSNEGISLKCQFRNDLKVGGRIQIESIVPKASGTWKVTKLMHNLTAHTSFDGPWESDIEAQYIR